MNFTELQNYLLPAGIIAFFAWRFLRFRGIRTQLPTLLSSGGVVVDVRSRGEFSSGSAKGSINIPLDELEKGSSKLDKSKPVIVCCASGTRSGMAASLLKRKGFESVVNAGPWRNAIVAQS